MHLVARYIAPDPCDAQIPKVSFVFKMQNAAIQRRKLIYFDTVFILIIYWNGNDLWIFSQPLCIFRMSAASITPAFVLLHASLTAQQALSTFDYSLQSQKFFARMTICFTVKLASSNLWLLFSEREGTKLRSTGNVVTPCSNTFSCVM